jgi:hypothetical protein
MSFSTGLFGCLSDPMTTVLTCFVAPFVIGLYFKMKISGYKKF